MCDSQKSLFLETLQVLHENQILTSNLSAAYKETMQCFCEIDGSSPVSSDRAVASNELATQMNSLSHICPMTECTPRVARFFFHRSPSPTDTVLGLDQLRRQTSSNISPFTNITSEKQ